MKISELLKEKATISFEVFPPKNKEGDISSIYYTIEELAKLDPDFISVTYGAGGSIQVANLADSLAAVKQMVYDDKKINFLTISLDFLLHVS